MDLRSSTEELYFLEGDKEKAVESSDKFTQQVVIVMRKSKWLPR